MPTPIFSEDYRGPRWTYGLLFRPVASCHLPKGWIIGSEGKHPDYKLFGTIQFPFKLSDQDVAAFELELVEEPKP